MRKRLLTVLLVMSLVIGCMIFGSCGSKNQEYELNEDGQSYTFVGGGNYTNKTVTVDSEHKGLPVTAIGNGAFYQTFAKEIILPNSIKTIGSNAFAGTRIEKITIPEGVTYIGENALGACDFLTEVILPESLTTVGERLFGLSLNKNLKYTTVLNDINYLGNENNPYVMAVSQASEIDSKQVVLPDGCKIIYEELFKNNSIIEQIKAPSITQIGADAFYKCTSLFAINEENNLDNIISIGRNAFYDCQLSTIELGASLKYIGNSTFDETDIGLMSYKGSISNWLNVEQYASVLQNSGIMQFEGATSEEIQYDESEAIAIVKIPNGTTKINDYAFYNWALLSDVVLPDGITDIGKYAFDGTFYLESSLGATEDGCIYSGNYLLRINYTALTEISIKEGTVLIGDRASRNNYIAKVSLPSTMKYIGDYAFYDRSPTQLSEINFPEGLVSIGDGAFESSKLTSISLPSTLEVIGDYAFYRTSLNNVTIPEKPTILNLHPHEDS